MKRVCEVCGSEQDERWMMSYNSGRKTHWLCWDCFKMAQREMHSEELGRKKRIERAMNSRKKVGRL